MKGEKIITSNVHGEKDGCLNQLKKSSFVQDCCKINSEEYQILGNSKYIRNLCEKINQISLCDVDVLITGESGTGKEMVAGTIHNMSSRSRKPFVPVNCGAIPENVFENELFGHINGAFTDARSKRPGLVNEAEGGILFLDEIGSVSPYLQVKFLRLLQNKEYKPLGDSYHHKANLRIIAATNKNLLSDVKEGAFREDLFYRLNVVSINVLPLRERKEDIPILIEHFINKYAREYRKPARRLSEKAIKPFIYYPWPGNVRELENKIQQLVVMSDSEVIDYDEVCFYEAEVKREQEMQKIGNYSIAKQKVITDFERNYLIELLTESNGNMSDAAKIAGKSRTALWNLLKKHNISPRQFFHRGDGARF